MRKEITFIKVPSEISAGTRGASLGPEAMKTASFNSPKTADYFDPEKRNTITIKDQNHLLFDKENETKYRWAKRIDGLGEVYKPLAFAVMKEVSEGRFPIVLAGDHGTAAATIKGVVGRERESKIGAIWIDAHADLHTPYTTPSGNMHGMTLALAMREDNITRKKTRKSDKLLTDETIRLWNQLKRNFGGVVEPERVVLIGVRDTEIQEKELMEEKNILQIPVRTMREKGYHKVGKQTIEHLKKEGCDGIYISFDVDSLDQSISRGTGTPVIDGFAKWEVIDLINYLIHQTEIPVKCLEIVEINPTLDDKKNKMAEVAFEILSNITSTIEEDEIVTTMRYEVLDY